jgi:hypothetical protein
METCPAETLFPAKGCPAYRSSPVLCVSYHMYTTRLPYHAYPYLLPLATHPHSKLSVERSEQPDVADFKYFHSSSSSHITYHLLDTQISHSPIDRSKKPDEADIKAFYSSWQHFSSNSHQLCARSPILRKRCSISIAQVKKRAKINPRLNRCDYCGARPTGLYYAQLTVLHGRFGPWKHLYRRFL